MLALIKNDGLLNAPRRTNRIILFAPFLPAVLYGIVVVCDGLNWGRRSLKGGPRGARLLARPDIVKVAIYILRGLPKIEILRASEMITS